MIIYSYSWPFSFEIISADISRQLSALLSIFVIFVDRIRAYKCKLPNNNDCT